jgi:hypothetical protein
MLPRSLLVTALFVAINSPSAPAEAESAALSAARHHEWELCTFYRVRARGLGLQHWATELVWACEMVAERRAANMPLNDRMLAVEHALVLYRDALLKNRRDWIARREGREPVPLREAEARLAAETGMLAALEAIQQGF